MQLATLTQTRPEAPNVKAMNAAIDGWIAEAARRPDGPALLSAKAEWVEQQLRALSASASRDEDPPKHLVGLTAFDLIEGQLRLTSAGVR